MFPFKALGLLLRVMRWKVGKTSEEERGHVDQLDLVKFPKRVDGSVLDRDYEYVQRLGCQSSGREKWMVEFF